MLLNPGDIDPTQLPWEGTEDVGVYWIGLAPLLIHHH